MKKMILNEVGDIMENIEAVIFELIVHSGNARGMLFEALDAAEADNHEQSVMCMQQAEAEMTIAHNLQTKLIQDDLKGSRADQSFVDSCARPVNDNNERASID